MSAFGVLVIACWLVLLIAGFDVVLGSVLHQQADSALQTRAEAAASTVVPSADGSAQVVETDSDPTLDANTWVYQGARAIERGSGSPQVQHAADLRAAAPGSYATTGSLRLYSTPVARNGKPFAVVVASINLTPYEHATKVAMSGTALLAVLAVAGAWVVLRITAARALRPVQAMSAQAAAWSERAHTDRFGRHQGYHELDTLAHHLDALLDRLAAVLRHERQLSGELSHELRTPLSRITSEADLLLRRSPDCPEASAIHAAAASMSTILETLLSTARLETGLLPGTCLLPDVLAELGRPDSAVEPDADLVGVDAAVASRILAPILDNADRYAVTTVVITARRAGSSITVDVHDDGTGIADDLLERVFEPGFRADPADGHDGGGLGLPLARRLARAADGDVTVLPAGDATGTTGTTVRVTLPPG
ncbi:signal transduction histidine kinase [Labedaea rhizosphaerae]|uniref:histidine kinase n=1 Tax=Labedaea rhizosphaerae TaxID=598644 RepID=A0A4R6SIG3_LABRH|nr:signal transduction histidine kinase [Labedaea rhizosphaerae]